VGQWRCESGIVGLKVLWDIEIEGIVGQWDSGESKAEMAESEWDRKDVKKWDRGTCGIGDRGRCTRVR
jgi:hypothetical protein